MDSPTRNGFRLRITRAEVIVLIVIALLVFVVYTIGKP